MQSIENVTTPKPNDIIIDIRHPDEVEQRPLNITANQVIKIPFFNLNKCLDQLNRHASYLLYCDKGVMSRLHADALGKLGFNQIGIFTPSAHSS